MKFILLFFLTFTIYAQNRINDPFETLKKMREEMFDTLLNQDQSDFDKRIQKLFDRLQKQGAFPPHRNLFDLSQSQINSYWQKKGSKERYVIELGSPDDKLDIDIKNGVINISGTKVVTNKFQGKDSGSSYSQRSYKFSKTENIPPHLDAQSAKFLNESGKLVIEFTFKSVKGGKRNTDKRNFKIKDKGKDI